MKIIIVDTETTELLNKKTKNTCRIVQLSWILYNDLTKEQEENDFILNTHCEILNSEIHGITTERSKNGYDFSEIINIFFEDVEKSDLLVGHNIKYDINALEVELAREKMDRYIEILYRKKYYDTMIQSVQFSLKNKFLKLTELYFIFFQENFENAHNALADVRATLKCYLKLKEFTESNEKSFLRLNRHF